MTKLVLACALVVTVAVSAQVPAKQADAVPTVPETVKKTIADAQLRAQAYELAKQALQEKQDAAIADLQRAVTAAQQACGKDYELTPQLTCGKKVEKK